jgi:hypothetical protein
MYLETTNRHQANNPPLAPLGSIYGVPHIPAEPVHLPQSRIPRTEQDVIDLILLDDLFVGQALTALNAEQTPKEQLYKVTEVPNRVGFSRADAKRLGGMADSVLAGRSLSSADLAHCREIQPNGRPYMAKYRGQILSLLGDQDPQAPAQENSKREVRQ